jgi:hypothetical protein
MAAEYDVGQLLPLKNAENVPDVRLEIDVASNQVRPLAEAREGGCEDLMTGLTEPCCDTLPAPAAAEPVNKNETAGSRV